MKTFFWTLSLVLILAAAATHGRLWRVPDRHNPWAPLSLEEPPGWLTAHKLARLDGDGTACRAALAQAPFKVTPVPDRENGPGCGFQDAVRVTRTHVAQSAPFTLTCPAAVSLALWERHVLLPAAQAHLGSGVARVDHFGTYACRNVYGRSEGRRSEHATANAFDFAGVELADRRRITVAAHWRTDGGDARAAFLRDAHAGACRFFGGVLGPAYNAAHADHFHLDRGRYRLCR